VRDVIRAQQIVDGGRTRSAFAVAKVSENFAEESALGMWAKVEFANEDVCFGAHGILVSAAGVGGQSSLVYLSNGCRGLGFGNGRKIPRLTHC
jgi:hypothetical protein